jgi:signal transduction histidine kinase
MRRGRPWLIAVFLLTAAVLTLSAANLLLSLQAAEHPHQPLFIALSLSCAAGVLLLGLSAVAVGRHLRHAADAERQTREAMLYAVSLVESVREPILVLDERLSVASVNRAFLNDFGAEREQVTGRPLAELGQGEWDVPELARRLRDVLAQSAPLDDFVLERDFPFLGRRYLLINARPMHHPVTRERLILLGILDQTVPQRTAEALRERERELREQAAMLAQVNGELEAFSYSVSHDLRAPLRHVTGFIELLRKQLERAGACEAKADHYMRMIADAARQMGQLIDDLLGFARMSRGELARKPVDMNDLVRRAITGCRDRLAGREVRFDVQPLPSAVGDPDVLGVVWVNLVDNALKYTAERERAEVRIGAREENGEVVYYIEDNGVGFDMRHADRLFGVFARLHADSRYPGTGIGLATVKRIISRHGGRVEAEGRVGEGARFSFRLPRAASGLSIPGP